MNTKKRVVIIGGGFAGSYIAKKLEKSFSVTLIDNKDFFEFTPSILRTLVEPSHIMKIILYHKLYLKKTYVINGTVTSFDKKNVNLGKLKIPYDYLVIASGSKYNSPIKDENIIMTSRSKDIRDSNTKLKKSKNILIVGGGLVGVELASEIATKLNKEIAIIDSNERLISRNPKKASNYVENFLIKHDVKLILGERLVEYGKGSYFTDKKKKINADLVYICTGIIPNSEFIESTNKELLDERKFLIVNDNLQVKNNENIFGAGDIINIREEKTAQNAEEHANVIVKNIKRLNKNKALKKYHSRQRVIVLSLGKYNGLMIYRKFFISGFIPALLKSYIEKSFMRK